MACKNSLRSLSRNLACVWRCSSIGGGLSHSPTSRRPYDLQPPAARLWGSCYRCPLLFLHRRHEVSGCAACGRRCLASPPGGRGRQSASAGGNAHDETSQTSPVASSQRCRNLLAHSTVLALSGSSRLPPTPCQTSEKKGRREKGAEGQGRKERCEEGEREEGRNRGKKQKGGLELAAVSTAPPPPPPPSEWPAPLGLSSGPRHRRRRPPR